MAIEVLSDLDWSDMNECCSKCIAVSRMVPEEDEGIEACSNEICPCHTDKGECPYIDCPKVHYFECPTHGTKSHNHPLKGACLWKLESAPTQPESSWETRFQETLKNRMRMNNDAVFRNEIPWVMDFIRTLVDETETRTMETTRSHYYESVRKEARLDLLAELEEKLPLEESNVCTCYKDKCKCGQFETGKEGKAWNAYRTTVLNIIKSIKGE